MNRNKIIYWTSTGLIAAGMTMSAFMYLTKNAELMNSFRSISIPEYLITILGVAKLLGAIALLAPIWPAVKEWAYAGFTFTFIGAVCAHVATATPWMAPLIFLLILGVSYWSWGKLKPAGKP